MRRTVRAARGEVLPIGTPLGPYVTVSEAEVVESGGQRRTQYTVKCPLCGLQRTGAASLFRKVPKCRCDRPPVKMRTPEEWASLVEEASEAFGTDFRYAEAMARDFHRLQERDTKLLNL